MMTWEPASVDFRFALGDWELFTLSLPLQARSERLLDNLAPVEHPPLPDAELLASSQGYSIRQLPIARRQPILRRIGNFLCYVPLQYQHCYIDLSWSYEQYEGKFSSKSRSTLRRKIKKYREHCQGKLEWKCYRTPGDIPEFLRSARQVSRVSYQERLLGAGIPETPAFAEHALALAEADRLRAFVLFDGARPTAYLYCPDQDGVLIYGYLGYDPEYASLSAGTVLQWLALEYIFREKRFRYFDFTEGDSPHKQLFASHSRLCANVFFVRHSWRNAALLYSHFLAASLSRSIGDILHRLGVKAKVKRLLRRG